MCSDLRMLGDVKRAGPILDLSPSSNRLLLLNDTYNLDVTNVRITGNQAVKTWEIQCRGLHLFRLRVPKMVTAFLANPSKSAIDLHQVSNSMGWEDLRNYARRGERRYIEPKIIGLTSR